MAIVEACDQCGVLCSHSSSEPALCDECSGLNAARAAETARWESLTVEQKIEELKQRLDVMNNRVDWSNKRF